MKTRQNIGRQNASAARVAPESTGVPERPHALGPVEALLSLQRSHGNRFVHRLVSEGLIQRKCACGGTCEHCREGEDAEEMVQRKPAGGNSSDCRASPFSTSPMTNLDSVPGPEAVSNRLRIADVNDPSEIEAERIAGKIVGESGNEFATGAPSSMLSVIHRVPSTVPATTAVEGGSLGPGLEKEIAGAATGGEPLGESTRAFFEAKLGTDFRQVQIHSGAAAAAVSDKLQADAFTLGRDVFFNRGRYKPASIEGMKLLAHELVHVIQQKGSTIARRLLQRSKIPYRTLTWSDFKAAADMSSTWAAVTASGFAVPGWTPKRDAVDTKQECTINNKRSSEFTATVKLDPAVFDGVVPLMTQEESWVKPKYKDNGKSWCSGQATDCETDFDKLVAQAKKDCKQEAGNCTQAFKDGSSSYTVTVGNTKITASDAGECTSKLQPACEAAESKPASPRKLSDTDGTTFASASTKADCKKDFLDKCKVHMAAESAWLLKHEQGHFDISKVMADKAQASLKAKAATFTATETRCGKVEAINAAITSFNAMNAPTVMSKLGSDWQDSKEKAESDYDDQTNHGLKKPEQTAWEGKITAGLAGYDPTAPPPAPAQANPGPAAPQATQGQPTAPPVQNPPPKTP